MIFFDEMVLCVVDWRNFKTVRLIETLKHRGKKTQQVVQEY